MSETLTLLAPLAQREPARRDFSEFMAWMVSGYEPADHSDLLCSYLEEVARGVSQRLAGFMPPRHGKTLTCSVGFPAYYLGLHPQRQVVLASHTAQFAETNSRAVRRLMQHERYPFAAALDPKVASVAHWRTVQGGGLLAIGAGGALTGYGADVVVIDDPLAGAAESNSQQIRDARWEWFTQDVLTRLNQGGAVVFVSTRWHEDDLAGRFLSSRRASEWNVLRLPALADGPNDPLGRDEGEPLWPQRFDAEALSRIEDDMGSLRFAALYQQRPTPAAGTLFELDWFQSRYTRVPATANIVLAVDTAHSVKNTADYSVIAAWACDRRDYYLIDVRRERLTYPSLRRAVEKAAADHGPSLVLIEDAGVGSALYQELQQHSRVPVKAVRARGSKQDRILAVQSLFEAGRIKLPEDPPGWLERWIDEHLAFPHGRHDDQVDTTAIAVGYLRKVRSQHSMVLVGASSPPRFGGGRYY